VKRVAIYARVSTKDQDPALQIEELRQAVSNRKWAIADEYVDVISGTRSTRPELQRLLQDAKRGNFDVLMVWKSNRMARSLQHLLDVLEKLRLWGVDFVSLTEPFDTTTSAGTLIFQIFGAIAEFERSLTTERVRAGIKRARKIGKHIGRPHVTVDANTVHSLSENGLSQRDIANRLKISQSTVSRILQGKWSDSKPPLP